MDSNCLTTPRIPCRTAFLLRADSQVAFGAISAILGELVDTSLTDYIDMDVAARSAVMLKLVQVCEDG
jgi:hypothetical protein